MTKQQKDAVLRMSPSNLDELEQRMRDTAKIPRLRKLYGETLEFINYCGSLLGVKKVAHQSSHGFAILAAIKEHAAAIKQLRRALEVITPLAAFVLETMPHGSDRYYLALAVDDANEALTQVRLQCTHRRVTREGDCAWCDQCGTQLDYDEDSRNWIPMGGGGLGKGENASTKEATDNEPSSPAASGDAQPKHDAR